MLKFIVFVVLTQRSESYRQAQYTFERTLMPSPTGSHNTLKKFRKNEMFIKFNLKKLAIFNRS